MIVNPAPEFIFDREGDGRYCIYLRRPRVRLGLVLGGSNRWLAESPNGQVLGNARTRSGVARLLHRDELGRAPTHRRSVS